MLRYILLPKFDLFITTDLGPTSFPLCSEWLEYNINMGSRFS
ncbi:hypothetical protein OFQ59_10175 [Brachyspira hyodysenteriae]|nr:hypothetical protein [Brachyspira hyodysenteriae]MCZ9970446.1 hypothetical protein [Brachyspira hyodysenteriae]